MITRNFVVIIVSLLSHAALAQFTLNSKAGPLAPPQLDIVATLRESSGDEALEAGEQASIIVKLTNQGSDARKLVVRLRPTQPVSGMTWDSVASVEEIRWGESRELAFAIGANENAKAGSVPLQLDVDDLSRANPISKSLSVAVKEAGGPLLEFVQSLVNGSAQGTVSPGQRVDIDLEVRNSGKQNARGVSVSLAPDNSVLASLASSSAVSLSDIARGESKRAKFSVVASSEMNADSLRATIRINEERSQFSITSKVAIPILKAPLAKEALAYASLQRGNADEAIRLYQEALKEKPKSAGIYFSLGAAYAAKGSMDKAIESYQRSSSLGDGRALQWLRENTREVVEVSYAQSNPFAGAKQPIGIVFLRFSNLYDILRTKASVKGKFILYSSLQAVGVSTFDPRSQSDLDKLKEEEVSFVLTGDGGATKFTLQLISTENGKAVFSQQYRDTEKSTALDDAARLFERSQRPAYRTRFVKR